MNINQLIAPDRVICLNGISSKKRVLEKLSQILSLGAIGYDPAEIFNRLIERERLGSTGLGHGVALPHGRYGEDETTIGAFVKLDQGIDFDSPDNEPTDLLFALLVPEHHTDEHLQVLASLAGMFSDKNFCSELRQCNTDEALFKHLSGWSVASEAS
ncbi:MAG: PTS sugar transporter subunit IIA [Gammaproteobacteria bacterium]|nr:PTS sugar transporter subunit IIA [Gammaproteobacteria bacterium]MCW8909507.1 PTS sugar transporter subunit IIA [Gammaproteobacteria bacterium]MCW9004410.1 PTS sugar transporter subunit IIA [Gammaproteobacteria bacterium]MCW9055801.1 PTS sugar transporter subunit IIA [Gammaproteobacteria bacterium]